MKASEALMLVKEKQMEEQDDITESELADRYRDAVEKYPVLMSMANIIWAMEVAKKMG